jgi:hypothetical protein
MSTSHHLPAGFPAEYGRKMGGAVEVDTGKNARPGLHGKAVLSGGNHSVAREQACEINQIEAVVQILHVALGEIAFESELNSWRP